MSTSLHHIANITKLISCHSGKVALRMSGAAIARSLGIDSLADGHATELVSSMRLVGLINHPSPPECDIGKAALDRAIATGVIPKFVNVAGKTCRRTVRGGDQFTACEWSAHDPHQSELQTGCATLEQEVIERVLRARVSASTGRAETRAPAFSISRLLDEVGIDAPTAGQLDYAEKVVTEIVGLPNIVRGETQWRVDFLDDGQWPDFEIVHMYPVPPSDWTFASFLIDQTEAVSRVGPIVGPGWGPLNVGALIF